MKAAAILLAAGESSRMGQPKALLPWQGTTLLQYELDQLAHSQVDETIVVLGQRAKELLPLALGRGREKMRVVVNRGYAEGMASSIVVGFRQVGPAVEAVMVLAVDQPRPAEFLDRLLEGHRAGGRLVTVPSYQGKHGHPSIFSGQLLPELLAITEAGQGLREIMTRHRDQQLDLDIDSPWALVNINTKADYKAALRLVEEG
ncbi:MAG: nucleotidyltransferase family protein [Chloroflexi bacterium]|nr:nucleotidyltransferase family protein [Chloroflexota bacterium]